MSPTYPYRSRRRLAFALAWLPAGLGGAPVAMAAEDGAYGRMEGDLTLTLEAGVAEAFPGESMAVRPSAHYLCSLGLFGQYNDSLGGGGQPVARSVGWGIELRPLFLARFFQDLERGPAYLDLLIDSVHVAVGIYAADRNPANGVDEAPDWWDTGLEFGGGLELPLLPSIDGPFIAIRGALRWSLDRSWMQQLGRDADGALMLTLGFHQMVATDLVDPEP